MKKLYITFTLGLIIAIGIGIFYFTGYRKASAEIPKGIVMEDINGTSVSFDQLPKKLKLVEFMYTKCPDICPITTYKMRHLRDELVKQKVFGTKIEFITITIDPKYDTIEILEHYSKTFDMKETTGWHLLRGDEEETKQLAESFNFRYRDPGSGLYIHTSNSYLLDENNRLIEVFGMGERGFDSKEVLEKIKEAM
ncbi:SCO family protein [Bacillus sp. WLY-B-L8]|uniref:SCO family protein n=1 Tax=Bacillus multifaciens TaxID=3068506 RepID=UPI002741B792|nr:SCO family protein [Bacillus sp. WLY-B-L8]MDP7981277.1 SCO family protein [Bacillus sp. WLY-B-L8]